MTRLRPPVVTLAFVVSALWVAPPTDASAQSPAGLNEGQRARATSIGGAVHVGRVESMTAEGLRLRSSAAGPGMYLTWASLRSIEVSGGRSPSLVPSVLVGTGLGIVALVALCNSVESTSDSGCGPGFGPALLIFGAGGSLAGLLFGAAIQNERWNPLLLPARGRTGLSAYGQTRVSLFVSLPFRPI